MLTLHYAPQSRASRIAVLLEEMGIADKVAINTVDIVRFDGSGRQDPANPHPEAKVPALTHDGTLITESAAIILYLTDLFPYSGLAPRPGDPKRGEYLSWLFWYGNVMEPVLIHQRAGLSHPALTATFRGMAEATARLRAALEQGPWLLGQDYSAADLLCHSPYAFYRDQAPDDPLIQDWIARCQDRPSVARVKAADVAKIAALAA